SLFGLFDSGDKDAPFSRAPFIEGVNGGVNYLSMNTAGGRVRFSTSSPYIAIYAEIGDACHMAHMPLTGSCGFDLYRLDGNEERFIRSFIPPTGICHGQGHYHSIIRVAEEHTPLTCYTVNFPLYNGVKRLDIGLAPGSELDFGAHYIYEPPIVYYGSSITQGGCASRPGNAYPALISHKTNTDYLNLGFSGSCVAEEEMADYIASLSMLAFVYDYDYNAPDTDYLKRTHAPFFKRIRKAHPLLPVIILSAPCHSMTRDAEERRDIIKATYDEAVALGDNNVYFIDGSNIFFKDFPDACTVDSVHPNDLGFASMASAVLKILDEHVLRSKAPAEPGRLG
ncbi:MAG: hypothetical protein IJD22_04595, partial [Clostridia bacterium]|nr:hypothetical protein [Clostridia bacterium]